MSSEPVNEIENKIREIRQGIDDAARDIDNALQWALDEIFGDWYVPDFVKQRAEAKAQEASREFRRIPPKTDPTVELILREINDYKAVSQTGPQYCSVDFGAAESSVGYDQLGPTGDDWESGNTQIYRTTVHALPTKLQNLRDAIEDICEIMTDLKGDYDSYFTGVLVAVIALALAIAGLVIAIAGLIAALGTGPVGVGIAIAGLVVAVLSAVVSVIAFATLTDMDAARATAAERLRSAATSVRNSQWPLEPSMDSGSW